MQKIIFSEEFCQPELLYPFSLIRQVQDIRIGMLSIRQKWELDLGLPSFDRQLDNYKDGPDAFRIGRQSAKEGCLLIHANLLPSPALVAAVKELEPGECIIAEKAEPVIFYFTDRELTKEGNLRISKTIQFAGSSSCLHRPWEIFQWAAAEIEADYERLTAGRRSEPVPEGSQLIGPFERLFIEPGATLLNVSLNCTAGPIYIGKNAVIQEASLLRGPVAILESGLVKMGTRLYGGTVIGRHAVAGGEIKNASIFDYSNKGHDGYLGDSVLGEWCNLGAGTSNSNLKNDASPVKIWTPAGEEVVGQKCGLLLGDYSRAAINTSFNTGTVTGISCNIFGSGLTPRFIPSFSWGADGIEKYRLPEALSHIRQWKEFKKQTLSAEEQAILSYIFEH